MGVDGLAVGVAIAGEGMADEDCVVGRRGELTPGLEGHRHVGEHATALQHEGAAGTDRGEAPVAYRVARAPGPVTGRSAA